MRRSRFNSIKKLKLSQVEYIDKVLQTFNINETKAMNTHFPSQFKLPKDQLLNAKVEQVHRRKSICFTYWKPNVCNDMYYIGYYECSGSS